MNYLENYKAMKILDLVLKHKWYDMIDRGEKKEEYRKIKPYWKRRLIEQPMYEDSGHVFFRDYDYVCFHRGYTSTTMIFTVREISMGVGKPEWGAPTDIPVFIIKLGERIGNSSKCFKNNKDIKPWDE